MKKKTCCFTGHRDIPSGTYQRIFKKTEEMVESLINKGYQYFGAGGALGFDTIAAFTVLKLKERYPYVRLILVLPCLTQTRGWSREDVEIYEDIKSKADKVVYTSQEYTRGCMHKRNRHLVDNSSACIVTIQHPINAKERKPRKVPGSLISGSRGNFEKALPVHIGNNVLIYTNVTICPGVTIGDNSIIGAGSVVTKDIPANVFACGVPCKVVREITEEDRIEE